MALCSCLSVSDWFRVTLSFFAKRDVKRKHVSFGSDALLLAQHAKFLDSHVIGLVLACV